MDIYVPSELRTRARAATVTSVAELGDVAEIQALTWSRCNERLGLRGITNRIWHLLLLTGLLRLMLFCCSQASTVQQQWKITREL